MLKEKPKIYIEPVVVPGNEYYSNILSCFETVGFNCVGSRAYWRKDFFINPFGKYFLWSWVEDGVCGKSKYHATKYFLGVLIKLFVLKLMNCKLVWIKHNYIPHKLKRRDYYYRFLFSVLEYLINSLANFRLSHSQSFCNQNRGFYFVPHPIYFNSRGDIGVARTNKYLLVGRLMRYKGILELLKIWPPGVSLTIKGEAEDEDFKSEMEYLIKERSLNVSFYPYFLTKVQLEDELLCSSNVIVTNFDKTMIASGVIVHALSFGCKVLASKSGYSEELEGNGMVTTYSSYEELASLVELNNFAQNSFNSTFVDDYFSKERIVSILKNILKFG